MADSKDKPRYKDPEPWAHKVRWLEPEEARRERQRVYGSTRIRMIPKRYPDGTPEAEDTAKEDE